MKILKNVMGNVIGLIMPLVQIILLLVFASNLGAFIACFFLSGFLSIILICLNDKYKLCNVWVFALGFIFPSAYLYIMSQIYSYGTSFDIMFTLVTVFYSLPFFIISLIIAICVKVKTTRKRRLLITGLFVLIVLFCVYWTVWRVDIGASSYVVYLDDYQDYYFTTVYKPNTMPAPFGSDSQIIYFKPGQKQKMLEKIKNDVTDILDTLIEEHSDIFYKYEISDDFTFVNLHTSSSNIDGQSLYDMYPNADRVWTLIPLYHNIKGDIELNYPIIKLIEPDN